MTRWTPERLDVLEQMWLWGVTSGAITENLGDVTRNAVMGKINVLGLMGRGGERLRQINEDAAVNVEDIHESVGELLGEPYEADNAMHRNAAVALTMLIGGCHVGNVASLLKRPIEEVHASFVALDTSGAWSKGKPPPSAWWHHAEGSISFMLDMMASVGKISIHNASVLNSSERSYGRGEHS